jgi:hypothetical protein
LESSDVRHFPRNVEHEKGPLQSLSWLILSANAMEFRCAEAWSRQSAPTLDLILWDVGAKALNPHLSQRCKLRSTGVISRVFYEIPVNYHAITRLPPLTEVPVPDLGRQKFSRDQVFVSSIINLFRRPSSTPREFCGTESYASCEK